MIPSRNRNGRRVGEAMVPGYEGGSHHLTAEGSASGAATEVALTMGAKPLGVGYPGVPVGVRQIVAQISTSCQFSSPPASDWTVTFQVRRAGTEAFVDAGYFSARTS